MNVDQRARLLEILELLASLPDSRRADAARLLCGDDASLRVKVDEALSQQAQDQLLERIVTHAARRPDGPPVDTSTTTLLDRPNDSAVGRTIGVYKIRERIGEGGFGEVFAAEQSEPINRRVAIKIIKPGMDSRAVVARFEAERQALAMMAHPHIANVLDAGTTPDGRPYFVMELVRGVPITEYCEENRLSPRERIELMIPVCQAIQHAHQKGIIHRDIKPGNVLVTILDGKPVPKVIDFGIAKAIAGTGRLTDKTIYTAFRQFIGTPGYMSPEQLLQSAVDVDTRSDVYALGVLMYELLSGSLPFDTDSLLKEGLERMQQVVREQDPPKPSTRVMTMDAGKRTSIAAARRLQPDKLGGVLRGEVDWMVMKAVEKDRNRRYQSPTELADDLRRFLSGEAVKASPPSGLYRARKFLRRYRGPVTLVAVAFAGLIALTVSIWWGLQASRAEEVRTRAALMTAEEESKARQAAEGISRRRAAAATLSLATEFLAGERYQDAAGLIASIPQDLRGWEWRHVATLDEGSGRPGDEGAEQILTDRAAAVRALRSEGQRMFAPMEIGIVGEPGELMSAAAGTDHWELYGAKRGGWGVVFTPLADRVLSLRIAPDGRRIAGSFGRAIQIVPAPPLSGVATGRVNRQKLIGAPAPIVDFAWSPGGHSIIAKLDNGKTWTWTLDDSAGEMRLPLQSNTIFRVAQSDDGSRYFLGCWGMVRAVDAKTFAPLWTTSFTRFYVEHLVPISDGRLLAIASGDQPEATILEASTGKVLNVWSASPVTDLPVRVQPPLLRAGVVATAAVPRPSGTIVLMATGDGSLHALDTATWFIREVARPVPAGHARTITALAAEPGGLVAIAETLTGPQGARHQISVLSDKFAKAGEFAVAAPVRALCWTPSPARLMSGDVTGVVHMLDPRTGAKQWSTPTLDNSPILALAWMPADHSPAGPRAVASCTDGRLIWLDPADGEPVLTRFEQGAPQLFVSPDGAALFAAPIARLEITRDARASQARVLSQRMATLVDLGPTAEAREAKARAMKWASEGERDLAVSIIRGFGDDLAMRNSDALTVLQREPATAIEAKVLPITTMLTKVRPHSPSITFTHAWALVQSGRTDEAAAALERWQSLAAKTADTPAAEILALQARVSHRRGQTKEAADLLAAAIAAAGPPPLQVTMQELLNQAQAELGGP